MIWHISDHHLDLTKKGSIMGILNVTPDSFSDAGKFHLIDHALLQANQMILNGADIIDVGGESTRPGATPVTLDDELSRTIPLITALRAAQPKILISIDTSKPEVARQALAVGANIINDVTGFRHPEMLALAANSNAGLVCMHMQGNPQNMQDAPQYDDVIAEIRAYFQERLETFQKAGITANRVCFDPGIGFGKRLSDNLAILQRLEELRIENCPLLIGTSKKSFIAKLLGEDNLTARNAPTVALTALLAKRGANLHRVHDVKENAHALRMIEAITHQP